MGAISWPLEPQGLQRAIYGGTHSRAREVQVDGEESGSDWRGQSRVQWHGGGQQMLCGVFFAFLVLFTFSSCGALLMHAAQVETGAWSGQASIQYDVSEVRTQIVFTELPFANK